MLKLRGAITWYALVENVVMPAESNRETDLAATAAHESLWPGEVDTAEIPVVDDAALYDAVDLTAVHSGGEPTRVDMRPLRQPRAPLSERPADQLSPRERTDRMLKRTIVAVGLLATSCLVALGLNADNESRDQSSVRPAVTTTTTLYRPVTTVPDSPRRDLAPVIEETVPPTTEQPTTTTTTARRAVTTTTLPALAQQIIDNVQKQIEAQLSPPTTAANTVRATTTTTVPAQPVGVPTTRLNRSATAVQPGN